ncbi:AI-2E family transporter [Microcoleus sp. FACHB-68]|uniref:AI-2E family transporter n=1 Tax=Microcoleus sp. FACHB-68 TaxID=2692826 RepID=UPI00168437D5|nr:AI-2E family transporter [Microcoleus sp. FACHB-68]MBD1938657.1 AI-2E family transporter [Microcoleus sp. FACHB-68]
MSNPATKNFWDRLSNLALIRFLLFFAAGWAGLRLLQYFETVIVVFTIAAILAFLLSYPVRWLRRFLPHGAAVGVVFLLGFLVIGGMTVTVGVALLSQGQQLIDSVTDFVNALAPLSERIENFLRARSLQVNLRVVEEQLRTQALAGVVSSMAILQIFLANLLNFILIMVVSFFMLLDGKRLWELLLKVIPRHLHKRLNMIVERNFLGFFKGQILLMLFLVTSTFIIFLLLNVNFPLILAVLIGIFDLIPGIGATLGITLISFIVLSQNVWLALKVFLACIVLQQIQDNIIYPRIMQNSLNIHPVVVFFALLVGGRAAGLLGIFIAIPLAGVFINWFEIDEMKGDAELIEQ